LQQEHHNTNWVFEGASYLGIIFANNKSPLVLSASAAKRGKLACNQLKKELAVHECIPNYTTFA